MRIERDSREAKQREAKCPARCAPARRRIVCAALLLAGGLVVATGSNRVPADATETLEVHGTTTHARLDGASFRIAAFNIHGGKGLDGRCDLARIADRLQNYDIVGMSESYGGLFGSDDQAAIVARQLDRAWLFAPTSRRWWQDHIGNSLLFNVKLTGWHRIPLPCSQNKKFRNVVLASFLHNGRPVRLLLTHLDTRVDRERQLKIVLDLFQALEPPAILMGDLNTSRADAQLQALLATGDVRDAIGEQTADDPPGRIDWILTRGLECLSAGVTETTASDHPVVWAELSPSPQLQTPASERELPETALR